MSEPTRIAPGMLAIGVGCRSGSGADDIVTLVRRALERAIGVAGLGDGRARSGRAALFTAVEKQGEAGLREAAHILAMPIVFLPKAALALSADKAVTRSERVVQLFGVPSLAETAALAGAGAGAELIVPRISSDGVTCAVAAVPVRRPDTEQATEAR
jgi:cobalt-precorrin 5A hydrolase